MADARAISRGTNFDLAFRALPPDQREAIRAVHTFSRVIDDCVDESPDPGRARKEIQMWRDRGAACYRGGARGPAARAPRPPPPPFGLPRPELEEALVER